jgi:hypothetical protein
MNDLERGVLKIAAEACCNESPNLSRNISTTTKWFQSKGCRDPLPFAGLPAMLMRYASGNFAYSASPHQSPRPLTSKTQALT